MKVVLFNGSPHGRSGNTAVMGEALLSGFARAGAETAHIALADEKIAPCRGCHACWSATPGRCAIDDGMGALIDMMRSSDLLAFASPVAFQNVSGLLKTFFDRLTAAGGDPHARGPGKGSKAPGIVAIASAGFPTRDQFDVVSLWFRRVSASIGGPLLAEFYQGSGRLLGETALEPELAQKRSRYLAYLERCGEALALSGELGSELRAALVTPLDRF